MRLSICEFTTLGASFEEDLAAYRAAGVEGIGVCELKLGDGAAALLRESGLRATHCIPAVPSILPLPLMEGPDDPGGARRGAVRERAAARGARARVRGVPHGTGRRCVTSCARASARSRRRERPPAFASRSSRSIPRRRTSSRSCTRSRTRSPSSATSPWGSCSTPGTSPTRTRSRRTSTGSSAYTSPTVASRRAATSTGCCPATACSTWAPSFRALEAGGYDGWYDVEIFSDNGAFGDAFADSLWDVEPAELARRARESFERVWAER